MCNFGFTVLVCLWLILPLYAQTFSQYPIPSRTIAGNVCTSPDNLYVYFDANTTIGRSDMSGSLQEFSVPTMSPLIISLVGCTFGSDGTLYFGEQNSGVVYEFNPATFSFSQFKVPTPKAGMVGMVYNMDNVVYIMAPGGSLIERMHPDGTFLPNILLSAGRYPHGPSSCGGNVWFAENTANRVAFVTPAGALQEFVLPHSNSKPFDTVCGADNGVYFTEDGGNQIGRIDLTSFAIQEWKVPTPASQPRGMATSATTLCFSEYARNKIGCMPVGGGTINETVVPVLSSGPNKVTLGPDGGFWFSTGNAAYIMNLH